MGTVLVGKLFHFILSFENGQNPPKNLLYLVLCK